MYLKEFKTKLMKNPKFREEYTKRDLAREASRMLVEARIIKGVTQAKLAKMIHTKQSGIARAENGNYLPSLSFLDKIAKALNTHVNICFDFMIDKNKQVAKTIDSKTQENIMSTSIDWPTSHYPLTYPPSAIFDFAQESKSTSLNNKIFLYLKKY